ATAAIGHTRRRRGFGGGAAAIGRGLHNGGAGG
ncbi:MAG: hypothetical protein QOD72_3207, partial [Acidimicrobiaceae bacterium]|nr:hypothetical protein [Acidimicrobiaceae bacterium]